MITKSFRAFQTKVWMITIKNSHKEDILWKVDYKITLLSKGWHTKNLCMIVQGKIVNTSLSQIVKVALPLRLIFFLLASMKCWSLWNLVPSWKYMFSHSWRWFTVVAWGWERKRTNSTILFEKCIPLLVCAIVYREYAFAGLSLCNLNFKWLENSKCVHMYSVNIRQ